MGTLKMGSTDVMTENSGTVSWNSAPEGTPIRVLSENFSKVKSVTTNNWEDIDNNFYVDIAPRENTNRTLIMGTWCGNAGAGNQTALVRLVRVVDGVQTTIAKGDDDAGVSDNATNGGCALYGNFSNDSNDMNQVGFTFYDNPSTTSTIRYKLQHRSEGTSYTTWTNRRRNTAGNNNVNDFRGFTNLTVMEIQGPASSPVTISNNQLTATTGAMKYIDHVTRTAYGNIGDHTSYYPTNFSSDQLKSLFIEVPYSSYKDFSKIKIEFTFSMRVNKATHAFGDYRLIRWSGGTTVSGETSLLQGQYGVVNGGTEAMDVVSGSAIDDVSSLTSGLYYAIQYRNASGNSTYASDMYFGQSGAQMQMIITGIY